MAKSRNVTTERDFQEVATEHGENAVKWMREELDALEHAQGCDHGCSECSGTGLQGDNDTKCDACDGEGTCRKGFGADCVECWHDEEAARRRIEEGPLSVEVRSGWYSPGSEDVQAEEYNILLGTGGPAARIIGELDEHAQPMTAHYEYQDWFKPWTEARLDSDEEAVLLKYAQQFYFGE